MKVLFVYPSNRKSYFEQYEKGEAPEGFLYFLPSLFKLGVEVSYRDVAQGDWLSKLMQPWQKLTIRLTGAGFKLDQALRLAAECNRHDVVFATTDSPALPLLLLRSLGLVRVPVVVSTIGMYDGLVSHPSAPLRPLYARLYRQAARVVSFSGRTQLEKLGALLGLDERRLVSVPLCIDTAFYRPLALPPGDFAISIGRDPMRDYPSLFKTAAGLGIPFKVLTSPGLVKGLEVPPNVELLFDHPMRPTAELLSRSRFYLHFSRPNHYLAGHTTFLAAMASGKLAVFNDSAPDLPFRDGENCVIVRDAADAVARLRSLLSRPDELDRIARAGHELVTTRFPAAAAAAGLKRVFEEAL